VETSNNLDAYRDMQNIAKQVLAELSTFIDEHQSESSIAERAVELLAGHGIISTWYHNCPAFVLVGDRTTLSISGTLYKPRKILVGQQNLVTVDLSPCCGEIWGDCARSFYVENGRYTDNPMCEEFLQGKNVLEQLHSRIRDFLTPSKTFAELFEFGNQLIHKLGFENLDFQKNLGHSIETSLDARKYVEQGNDNQLGSTNYFTFEPHIARKHSEWGFKHESIYYFDEIGKIAEL
jgi:Xaa-Pro aminopeptidase